MTDNEAFLNALNLLRQHLHATIDQAINEISDQYSPRDTTAILAEDLVRIEALLNRAVAADSQDRYRMGTEVHGKLRRAAKDLTTLDPDSAATAGIREQLRVLTERVLKDVFALPVTDLGDAAGNQN